jgi:hypothetical protein
VTSQRSSASRETRRISTSHGELGRLHAERVGGAAAIALEVDAPVEVVVEDRVEVLLADAAVEKPLGQDDDVAGEAVAAHVRRLPDPFGVDLPLQPVVERPPVLRAAAVALSVRADDEERVLDRDSRGAPVEKRRSEVVADEVVVVVELEPIQPLLAGPAAAQVEHPALVGAPFRPLDEEEAGVPELAQLVAQVLLERLREKAPAEHVAIPETAVFDEHPAVDAACRRGEVLVCRARHVCAELSLRSHGHCWKATHCKANLTRRRSADTRTGGPVTFPFIVLVDASCR